MTSSKRFATCGNETAIANVASASETPREAQGREAEEEADHAGDEPGERDREDRPHPVSEGQPVRRLEQQSSRPGRPSVKIAPTYAPIAHERAVAERDLAVVAREDVEPEQRR